MIRVIKSGLSQKFQIQWSTRNTCHLFPEPLSQKSSLLPCGFPYYKMLGINKAHWEFSSVFPSVMVQTDKQTIN